MANLPAVPAPDAVVDTVSVVEGKLAQQEETGISSLFFFSSMVQEATVDVEPPLACVGAANSPIFGCLFGIFLVQEVGWLGFTH